MSTAKPTPKPTPRAPAHLAAGGRRLWDAVVTEWDLEEHELALLREAARTVDLLADLTEHVRADGPLVSSPQGLRAHPAAVEARQQRITLARLLAALGLPLGVGEDDSSSRTPRGGVRGVYGIRGAV